MRVGHATPRGSTGAWSGTAGGPGSAWSATWSSPSPAATCCSWPSWSYYFCVARASGNFPESAVTDCGLVLGLSAPVPGRVLACREAGPPARKNRSVLGLGEADVQAEAAQHPDEPEGGQEGPRDDAAYGDGGGEQFNYLR